MSVTMPKTSGYQPISTLPSKTLDVCKLCSDRLDDCPFLTQCAETRNNTLELVKRKINARTPKISGERARMALAMKLNDICDMQCFSEMEALLGRCGGQHVE